MLVSVRSLDDAILNYDDFRHPPRIIPALSNPSMCSFNHDDKESLFDYEKEFAGAAFPLPTHRSTGESTSSATISPARSRLTVA